MNNRWIVWIRKGLKFIDGLIMNESGNFSEFKIENTAPEEMGTIISRIRAVSGKSEEPYKSYILSGRNKNEAVKILLIKDGTKKPEIFSHVIEVREEVLLDRVNINESAVNQVLKQVFKEKPDIILITMFSDDLVTVLSNLLKIAGYKHVINIRDLSGYFLSEATLRTGEVAGSSDI